MHIGLTYDLRDEYLAAGYSDEETAEFDRADTIDSIADALLALGHDVDRIGHVRQLVPRLAAGDRWDLVFNICEGLKGTGREAQVPAILDAYEIPYTFADPCVMCVCLDKAVTKSVVRNAGLPTPGFAVIANADDVAQLPPLRYPLFAKPIAEGTGKGVTAASRVNDSRQLNIVAQQLLEQFHQPVLVEEFLPGREFTVGILGTGRNSACLGTLEIVLLENAEADVYSYINKERCEELVEYRLVRAADDEQVRMAEQIALAAWNVLGCRDGGRIDLRCDADGQPQFLEANPLAGLHPFHSDLPMLATALDISYDELIEKIVLSASERCDSKPARLLTGSRR
ncbi:MAG: D-alanine--D-alanine ligase [Planctomycetaceae bacterium]